MSKKKKDPDENKNESKDDSEEWTREDQEWYDEKIAPIKTEIRKSSKRLDKSIKEFGKIVERIKTDNLNEEKRRLEEENLKVERVENSVEKQKLVAEVEFAKGLLLKKSDLPKNPDARVKQLEEVNKQSLKFLREREVFATGFDPEPLFLGQDESGKEGVYEIYCKCKNCSKVFRTFKNEEFCSPSCRYAWVKNNMNDEPETQEIWSERNNESWDWKPVGNRTEEYLGNFTVYRREFKEGDKKSE